MYICVRAHTCAFVHVRLRPCPYVCVRALASAFVRVCAFVFVCVHIIKSPDASKRIISDASGRVFHSRTFEVYYMEGGREEGREGGERRREGEKEQGGEAGRSHCLNFDKFCLYNLCQIQIQILIGRSPWQLKCPFHKI